MITTHSSRKSNGVSKSNSRGRKRERVPARGAESQVAKTIGCTTESLRRCLILDYKKKHPSMGPAQIRAQLKRFLGWRVSVKAIARMLRKAGYAPVRSPGWNDRPP